MLILEHDICWPIIDLMRLNSVFLKDFHIHIHIYAEFLDLNKGRQLLGKNNFLYLQSSEIS